MNEEDPMLNVPAPNTSEEQLRNLIEKLQQRYRILVEERKNCNAKKRNQRKDIKKKEKAIKRLKAEIHEYEAPPTSIFQNILVLFKIKK